jgi:hypothetical protein
MTTHICEEVFAVTRACERLLSTELKLTDDELSLLEYYMNELSREFFPRASERLAVKPSAGV